MLTQKHIARELGISQASVSKALRNDPGIAEETRIRIQSAAYRLGYHPNALGAGLASFKRISKVKPISAALAWLNVWPKPEELYRFREFELYRHGAAETAQKLGYQLEEFFIADQFQLRRLQTALLTRDIRGILIPPSRKILDWREFDWTQFSTIRFGRTGDGLPEFNMVSSTQFSNAGMAFDRVRERGYSRIGFVGYPSTSWNYLGGFLQAQAISAPEASRLPPFFLYEGVPWDSPGILRRFSSWTRKWKPEAIITESEVISILLKATDSRIPEDMAIAALNILDQPFDAGIYQNPEEIGRVATLVLISQLNENNRGIPRIPHEILVNGTWVDGSSLPDRTAVGYAM